MPNAVIERGDHAMLLCDHRHAPQGAQQGTLQGPPHACAYARPEQTHAHRVVPLAGRAAYSGAG